MLLSFAWTEASTTDALQAAKRHLRFAWLIAVFYVIRTKDRALRALGWLVIGQMFVVVCSWLMWAGIPIPWAITDFPTESGILFTSTLEQPVMSTLMLVVAWHLRDFLSVNRNSYWFWILVIGTIVNVFFVMTGRSGFLVMMIFIAYAVYWQLPTRLRWIAIILPLFLSSALFSLSPRFQQRVTQVSSDIMEYKKNGSIETSQGQRLDYWKRSLLSIPASPVLGHGVGSWKANYIFYGGMQVDPPSNPHQQYLLWMVEAGAVGLLMLIGIFVSLFRDAYFLTVAAKRALITTTSIAAAMSLMNCPFFGVGMGEFFLLMMGCMLCITRSETERKTNKEIGL
jgi:O-antigen ligase